MFCKPYLVAATLCVASLSAYAQVRVEDAWVRATVPQQHATGAFMKIVSDQPIRLVEARSPAAPTVEVHEMKLSGGVMTMRQVPGVDVVPGRVTELTPSGFHVMLLDLKEQVKAGDKVPLILVFEDPKGKRFQVEVSANARALGSSAGAASMAMPAPR